MWFLNYVIQLFSKTSTITYLHVSFILTLLHPSVWSDFIWLNLDWNYLYFMFRAINIYVSKIILCANGTIFDQHFNLSTIPQSLWICTTGTFPRMPSKIASLFVQFSIEVDPASRLRISLNFVRIRFEKLKYFLLGKNILSVLKFVCTLLKRGTRKWIIETEL